MLYLAQVTTRDSEGKAGLKLLAKKRADYVWAICESGDLVWAEASERYATGMLVLVELSSSMKIKQVQDAKDWVLEIVQDYLTAGVSPALLHEEAQRAEQWRQSYTMKEQEIGRRALEVEAWRDQIQELEENLKREKKQIEMMANALRLNAVPSAGSHAGEVVAAAPVNHNHAAGKDAPVQSPSEESQPV
ncbi:hypothetical protein [Thermoleptolyngbya sp. C42_A2020_037]|uniref:hypothetical protein n=1 Tax=Thermoleptolyngbya sp. C42_A2020_037 TaxID=2747799 RepID=UPI001A0ED9B8|nr:hypothetical protein [Thermoleptolyngbya sp. C42_A2020_037]MBF2083244.1 hypothetical protein [Thermoleptolyngbya sp. C42_A2020_037]